NDERSDLRHRVAQRRKLAAAHDGAAAVHGDHEPIDVYIELAQLARQEPAFLPVLLDEAVNPFRVRPDCSPDLRWLASALSHLHLVAPANTSLNAASSNNSARSSSASVMVNGGNNRITFP